MCNSDLCKCPAKLYGWISSNFKKSKRELFLGFFEDGEKPEWVSGKDCKYIDIMNLGTLKKLIVRMKSQLKT